MRHAGRKHPRGPARGAAADAWMVMDYERWLCQLAQQAQPFLAAVTRLSCGLREFGRQPEPVRRAYPNLGGTSDSRVRPLARASASVSKTPCDVGVASVPELARVGW